MFAMVIRINALISKVFGYGHGQYVNRKFYDITYYHAVPVPVNQNKRIHMVRR